MLEDQPYVRVIALDFSKAFDCLKHSTLTSKLSTLHLPDNIYNWVVDFLEGRRHNTHFNGATSQTATINASVVQGSAIGPAAYIVAASDLHPKSDRNEMLKYADDTYLIIPADNQSSCDAEIDNVEKWAMDNNLKLNKSKSMEIIFSKKKHSTLNLPPPPIGVTRVDNIKILGVTIESNLLVKAHVDNVLSSCSQSLHALRILRSRSLPDNLIHNVFSATIMSKLTYCSPAWRGFMRSVETDRMNAFLRKAINFNYCPALTPPINETLDKIDAKFFNSITTNSHHVLHHLLPPKPDHQYKLRPRPHSFTLPTKHSALSACNFLLRLLYKDSY